jgi:hypothetical protein
MKILWFALLAVLLSSQLTMAQEAPVAVIPEKISYSKTIPQSLKTFLPRGGKSRFWGQTKLRFENKPVWAWVYDAKKTYFKAGESNTNGIQKSGLDLFVFSKPSRLKRISSIRFNYWKSSEAETVGLESTWLDLKTRTRPVLRVKLQDPRGMYGMISGDVLVVFEAGFKKAVTQIGFGQGNSNGADYSMWNTAFVMDEDGQLNLVYTEDGTGGSRETTYQWRRNAFKPVSRRQSHEMDTPMVPIPLTEE